MKTNGLCYRENKSWVEPAREPQWSKDKYEKGHHLNASQKSSTHDTQFETMMSPVPGLQLSSV